MQLQEDQLVVPPLPPPLPPSPSSSSSSSPSTPSSPPSSPRDSGSDVTLLGMTINDRTEEETDNDWETEVNDESHALIEETQEPRRNTSFCSFISLSLFSFYFLGVCTSIVVILIIEKNAQCDQPLYLWVLMQLVILVASLFVRIWNTLNHYKGFTMDNETIGIWLRLQSRMAIFLEKLLNMLLCVWFLIGMVWTFKSETCKDTSPPLYFLSLTLNVINLFLVGVCVLVCFCVFLCIGLVYMCDPQALEQQNRGASKQNIQKLETKIYQKGLLDEEDSKCAICLSSYEEGDEIRFLPCKPKNHHYHRQCVDEWLAINKACPFCKRPIDEETTE